MDKYMGTITLNTPTKAPLTLHLRSTNSLTLTSLICPTLSCRSLPKGSTNEAEYTYSATSSCGYGYCAFSCNIGPSGAGTLAETLYLYRDPNVLLTPASTGFSSTSFMPDHEATPSPDIWSNVPPLTASLLNLPGLRLAPHRMPPSRGHTCRRKAPSPTCNSSAKVWATG